MFYDNFIRLCNSVGKAPSAVAIEIGISKMAVSGWKNRGSHPTDATAAKIAAYFGTTVEELMADEKEPLRMEGLSEDEAEFIEKLRRASPEIQQAVRAVLRSAEK